MSTTSTATTSTATSRAAATTGAEPRRAGSIDLNRHAPVPFWRTVATELRKSLDTRAGRALVIITAVLTGLVMSIMVAVAVSQDIPLGLADYLGSTSYSSTLLLPVVGILLMTGEWSQRTAMITFALEPRRGRVIGAKLAAGVIIALVVSVVALGFAALATLAATGLGGGEAQWSLTGAQFGGFAAGQVLAMVAGFALAALLLNTPAAVVLYFVIQLVLPGVMLIGAGLLPWFADLEPWINLSTAQSPLVSGWLFGQTAPPEFDAAAAWGHLAVSGAIWVLLPLVAGIVRVLRAEVK